MDQCVSNPPCTEPVNVLQSNNFDGTNGAIWGLKFRI